LNRWCNLVRRGLGLGYWSLAAAVKGRVKQAVSFVSSFEDALARQAAQRRVDGIVCGHIHRPELREMRGVLYCNTGDWVENCSALAEDDMGRLQLLYAVGGSGVTMAAAASDVAIGTGHRAR
jgi:UDP-2,3-diacylglucosamine pyrophosphatase LpxH